MTIQNRQSIIDFDPIDCNFRPGFLELPISQKSPVVEIEMEATKETEADEKPEVSKLLNWDQHYPKKKLEGSRTCWILLENKE